MLGIPRNRGPARITVVLPMDGDFQGPGIAYSSDISTEEKSYHTVMKEQ